MAFRPLLSQALPYTRAFIGIEVPEMELTMRSFQLGVGLLIVAVDVAILVEWLTSGETMGGRATVLLPCVTLIMGTVGLLAAVGPARRGLAIQPTEALRDG